MQLHTGYFGTLNDESTYSVDTVPTGMIVTDTVQFYLPDDGKMFTNGIVITDILIVGQDVIEDYGEVDDSGYVSILTKVNGKALFRNITLTASDVSALSSSTTINDLTTTAQQNALNSGITSSDVSSIGTALQPNDNVSELNNDSGFITGITSSDVTSALGYTPYSDSNPSGYTSNVGTVTSINNTSPDANGNVTLSMPEPLPAQTDNSGKFLTTNGTTASWDNIPTEIPTQTGNSGKFLTTNGSSVSWDTVNALPSQTSQSGKFLTTDGTDASWNNLPSATSSTVGVVKPDNSSIIVDNNGTLSAIGRNIGEIVPSKIPLVDAGLHLLDGSLLTYGSYRAFIDYIAGLVSTYPDLFETEANWQSSVTTYGVCGKFVYDSVNNTVRLPKITGIIEGTTDLTALGDLVEAGLPDHIHYVSRSGDISNEWVTSEGTGGSDTVVNYNGNMIRNTSNASVANSNSLYGKSNTVQPQTTKILYYIVIATTVKTPVGVEIDEIATDLNGKADVDLSNVSNTSGFRKLVEVYNNGSSWYKVFREYNPSTGSYIGLWCEQGGTTGSISSGTKTSYLKTFTNTNYTFTMALLGSTSRDAAPSIVKATDGFTIYHTAGLNSGLGWSWQACGYIS